MQWSKVWANWLILCNHCRFLSGEKKKHLPSISHDFQSNFSIQSKSRGHAQLQDDGLQLYRVPKRNTENSPNNQQTMKGPRTVPGVQ